LLLLREIQRDAHEQMMTYFHDASRAPLVLRCPTRNVVMIVVASTATHMTPTLRRRRRAACGYETLDSTA